MSEIDTTELRSAWTQRAGDDSPVLVVAKDMALRLLGEIDEQRAEARKLRWWKSEATTIIGWWEDAFEAAKIPAALGQFKSKAMLDEIVRLRGLVEQLGVALMRSVPNVDREATDLWNAASEALHAFRSTLQGGGS